MKKIMNKLILMALAVITLSLSAPKNYELEKNRSSIKVEGTSSLHDWDMELEQFDCDISIIPDNPSVKIIDVSFIAKTKSFKSHSSIMDRKTYNALEADEHPYIKFNTSTPFEAKLNSKSFTGTISGILVLAGKARKIYVTYSGKLLPDNRIQIIGNKKIIMSDYGIEPPTALLGTLKTGDEVTISFNFIFSHNE